MRTEKCNEQEADDHVSGHVEEMHEQELTALRWSNKIRKPMVLFS